MDDWQSSVSSSLADAFDRAVNAAVDISIMKETGIKQGPTFTPNSQQANPVLQAGAAGYGAASGLPQWVPMLAIAAAVALVVWKLAK